MSTHDIVQTPLPFPTLPVSGGPKSERAWIQNNWWVVFVIETLVFFLAFCALLVYYLCFVRSPGKWVTQDKTDSAGLSHYGSMAGGSERSPSERSHSNHSEASRRSFSEPEAPAPAPSRPEKKRGRGRDASRLRFVMKLK